MTTAAAEGVDTIGKNPLAMSDEDFLKQPPPVAEPKEAPVQKTEEELAAEAAAKKEVDDAAAAELAKTNEAVVVDPTKVKTDVEIPAKVEPGKEVNKDGKKDPASATTDPAVATATAKDGTQKKDPAATATTEVKDPAASQTTAVDYEKFYKQVIAPFKANGKQIEVRTPEEAIQLMQMGANYTRKMQDIQPHRKTLLMLENNGLMDSDKLNFLIDLDKGNPEAIKKFIKDKGIDPNSIDTSEEVNYLGGNHKVSDDEANFRNALDDLSSNPEGKVTLQTVNSTWDQASKEVLWKEPQMLSLIHQQRENGIYDRISTEVERAKALGQIPAGTPFINAYHAVGNVMQQQGKFNDIVVPAQETKASTATDPVATRVAATKVAVANSDLASAAAATRSTSGKNVEKVVNPLAMSDDEFLKQMANRV